MKTLSRTVVVFAALLGLCGPASSAPGADGDALFQQLGGKGGIFKIVEAFLPIVLADARIKESFNEVDMENFHVQLATQLCELAGGPCKYDGSNMQSVHRDLKITNAQFNAVAEDLQMAMETRGIASAAQNRLIAKLAPMARDIVTK